MGNVSARYVEVDPMILQLKGSRIPIYGDRNGFELVSKVPDGECIRRRVWRVKDGHPLHAGQETDNSPYVDYELKLRNVYGRNKNLNIFFIKRESAIELRDAYREERWFPEPTQPLPDDGQPAGAADEAGDDVPNNAEGHAINAPEGHILPDAAAGWNGEDLVEDVAINA